ncbi:MAG: hypothetical protein ACE5D6_10180, partial [Candidatus Zixiibacteriota bacterium]
MKAGSSIGLANFLSYDITFSNYLDLFAINHMGLYLFNSLIVGTVVTLGNILFCFMVAYTLARYKYLVNKFLFVSVIVMLMIPAHIIIIPMYILMVKAGLYDSYYALIIPWLVNP